MPRAQEPPLAIDSWAIEPAEGYQDETCFVRMELFFGTDSAQSEDQQDLPVGGRLTVHLGYRDIREANTLWYGFDVFENARLALHVDGEFDVPNIKGPDGYWWNDVDIDLPHRLAGDALVVITNRRSGAVYRFTLRRLESAIQPAAASP